VHLNEGVSRGRTTGTLLWRIVAGSCLWLRLLSLWLLLFVLSYRCRHVSIDPRAAVERQKQVGDMVAATTAHLCDFFLCSMVAVARFDPASDWFLFAIEHFAAKYNRCGRPNQLACIRFFLFVLQPSSGAAIRRRGA
jgi:hypothetical protein